MSTLIGDRRTAQNRAAMLKVSAVLSRTVGPKRYLWIAKWWRLHAASSANPQEPLSYARAQITLYRDMVARPEHYASTRRPKGTTDFQWSAVARTQPNPTTAQEFA